MEENRLKVMESYDSGLFNKIYTSVTPLKRKLASQIDSRRFGVDREEVLSWFDVKILFVFQKYHKRYSPDILLGMTINAMKCFKCRILRKAYTVQFSQSILEYDVDLHDLPDHDEDLKDHYSKVLKDFMRKTLSDDAYILWDLQMNPPPYILRKLKKKGIDSIHKIPADIILRYFDLKLCPQSYRFYDLLCNEIKFAIKLAKMEFRNN